MKLKELPSTELPRERLLNELIENGHDVTIATRGKTSDEYGDKVKRIIIERTNETSVKEALNGTHYDVVIDKIEYLCHLIYPINSQL